MKKQGILHLLSLTMLVVFLFHAATLSAAESSPENGWEFSAEVYLWGASIGGQSASGSDIDIDFGDLLDNLEMAFMGAFGARKGNWSFLTDVIYLDVKDKGTLAGRSASLELSGWVVTPDVGYTIFKGEKGNLDLHAGARYLNLDSKLHLGGVKVDESGDVWDGIVGIRGRIDLSQKWYLPYYLDIGTGDSDFTWQGSAGIGYQFKHFDIVAGYRYLEWDFDDKSAFDDLTFSGPYGGIKFYF